MSSRTTRTTRTRSGRLFRRASRWQQAVVVLCLLIALQGVYAVFVPPVRLADSDLACPPAIVAAVAGSGGLEITDGDADLAERHDAACATTGRRWLLSGIMQIALAAVWGLATLEWARVGRRRRRHRRRDAATEDARAA